MKKSVPVFTKKGEPRGLARLGLAASSAATAALAEHERRRKTDLGKSADIPLPESTGVWGRTKRNYNFA